MFNKIQVDDFNVVLPRYKLNDPNDSWIVTLQSQLNAANVPAMFVEKDCKFFDKEILANPFWVVKFIPSSRDPIGLFRFFEGGGSWIFPAGVLEEDEYAIALQVGMQAVEHGDLVKQLRILSGIFNQQVRGLPLLENREVYSFSRCRRPAWTGAFESGTIYFDRLTIS